MTAFLDALTGFFTAFFGMSVFGYNVWSVFFRFLGIVFGIGIILCLCFALFRLFVLGIRQINPQVAAAIELRALDAVHAFLFDSVFGRSVVDLISGLADAIAAVLRAFTLAVTVAVNRSLSVLMWPVEKLNNWLEPISRQAERDRLEREKQRLSTKNDNQKIELDTLKLRLQVEDMRNKLRKARRGEITPDQISSAEIDSNKTPSGPKI